MIIYLIRTIFGPELYRIYKKGLEPGRNYKPNNLEFLSNSFISFVRGIYVLCKWTSPVILTFAYYRGYLSIEGIQSLSNLAYVITFALIIATLGRGFGRYANLDYQVFIKKYVDLNKANLSKESLAEREVYFKKFLSQYDFKISNWIADFKPTSQPPLFKNKQHSIFHNSPLDTVKFLVWRLLSKICVNTFGLRMAYPGVVIKNILGKVLLDSRVKFIEKKRAQRAIVETSDSYKNKIDTLFVDQRNLVRYNTNKNVNTYSFNSSNNSESNGNYLVLCCDGNASFYEVGIFQLPIENGFSCLGWNYPGFGESTGSPYPEQLTAAADSVMQYAHSLGFKTENIILFSWSIGGFAVSWLANNYPNVKGVILDACFDHITPLAQQQMPKFASTFVEYSIKHNLNLDISDLIGNFNGPLLFIRRTQDEIISTVPKVPSTNRGNDLLLSTLRKRYPYIINEDTMPYIRTWLSAKSDIDRNRIFNSYANDVNMCESILVDYLKRKSNSFPINIGIKNENGDNLIENLSKDIKLTLALYLADKYLLNYESSHCQPLPNEYFKTPWTESDIILKYKF